VCLDPDWGERRAVTAASALRESEVPGSTRSVSICVLLCLAGDHEIGTCACRTGKGRTTSVATAAPTGIFLACCKVCKPPSLLQALSAWSSAFVCLHLLLCCLSWCAAPMATAGVHTPYLVLAAAQHQEWSRSWQKLQGILQFIHVVYEAAAPSNMTALHAMLTLPHCCSCCWYCCLNDSLSAPSSFMLTFVLSKHARCCWFSRMLLWLLFARKSNPSRSLRAHITKRTSETHITKLHLQPLLVP
jgi:hypothetical protein